MDSVGIGALPDAGLYGDEGSNTLVNIARAVGGLHLPHLGRLGLGNIEPIPGVPPAAGPDGAYGRMAERSAGKDTTTGHWEMSGIVLERPFPTYPHGFPPEVIAAFQERTGRPVLGNKAASGTVIIEELGAEHMRTGYPIVYTSADSVFQIAAHEEIIPLEQLYQMCQTARELLTGEHAVGRVIARPFTGRPGSFQRTANRRDFSLTPPAKTILDLLREKGLAVMAVGKIEDIFAGRGITAALHTRGNMDGVDATLRFMQGSERGLIFTNLVDFDMLYGHRNNPRGYADALEAFDRRLPEITAALRPDEVLMITADHGCDPTTSSNDHSREYVPLLVYGRPVRAGVNLGTRRSFTDIAATMAAFFGFTFPAGESFAGQVLSESLRRDW
ncbi:phosphopentomutase [Desulfotomaculum copahuensis]|uniref:Phosphopentomutase n=2 Tax=Desulfotomaculum copahuensis TaxID=1838280 RepID=A0A1B7LJ19_9FIRM|nr:phosphopentomutase [Desulfotomaculum copahuensis]